MQNWNKAEKALEDALKSKKIMGAAIDVWETEPATDNKLLELDNVVATPHLGAPKASKIFLYGDLAFKTHGGSN